MKFALLIIFAAGIFSSACNAVNSLSIERCKSKFERNRAAFDTLVAQVKLRNLPAGFFVDRNKLPDSTQQIISDLGVYDIILNPTSTPGCIEYEFSTSWSDNLHVYFSNDSCEKVRSRKGYYETVSQMVELWGLGDGWMMWVDHDFI